MIEDEVREPTLRRNGVPRFKNVDDSFRRSARVLRLPPGKSDMDRKLEHTSIVNMTKTQPQMALMLQPEKRKTRFQSLGVMISNLMEFITLRYNVDGKIRSQVRARRTMRYEISQAPPRKGTQQ